MSLTRAQANTRLGKIKTADELKALIRELDTTGTGSKTLLWSGVAGLTGNGSQEVIHSRDLSSSLHRVDSSFRTLATTEAARFLDLNKDSKNYNPLLEQKLKEIFKNNPDGIDDFLYGAEAGTPRKRTAKGVWDDVSESFVKQASGDVRLVVGGASLDRVFAQTEIQALLDNPAIKSIEGVPIDALKDLQRISGVPKVLQLLMGLSEANTSMIQIQVDSQGRPVQNMDGTFRLDATDYMQMSAVNANPTRGMRPVMDFIPESRRLRHQEAVEEIFKLHPILRSKKYALPINSDPFNLRTAFSRISDYGGKAVDALSLATMLKKAGDELNAGDNRKAHETFTSWVAETAGGFAAGRLASLLVAPIMLTGPVGFLFGAGVILGASLAGGDMAKKLHDLLRDQYRDIDKMNSPLVVDLDGNGIPTIGIQDAVIHFDHDNNGFAEKTGWIHPGDGFLILDINRNGKVDNGSELFGNHTLLDTGVRASNGFLALANYDKNQDSRIDRLDAIWSRLRVWRDQNSNGQTDAGELLSLSAANIKSLSVVYSENYNVEENGNAHRQIGFYEKTAGGSAALNDVWFTTDTFNGRPLRERTVSSAIAALPNIPGMGIVASLHQALMDPANTTLKQTLDVWLKATRRQRVALTEQLIFQWVNATINPFSNEERILKSDDPFIKEKVAVVEKLYGRMLNDSDVMIGRARAAAIVDLVRDIAFYVEMQLNDQSLVKRLFNLAAINEEHSGGSVPFDVTASVAHLRSQFRADPDPAFIPAIHWLLAHKGAGGLAFFEALQAATSGRNDLLGLAMRLQPSVEKPWEWIKGTAEGEVLQGTANDDFIEAGEGLDFLKGYEGNDSLHGGPGADLFYGGPGGDTYYLSQNVNLDSDHIADRGLASDQLPDRVVFWDVVSTSVTVKRNLADVILFSGGKRVLSIEGQITLENRIEEFHFADGVVWTSNTLMLHLPVEGTYLNDQLIGATFHTNRLQGNAGNDTVIGGPLPDHLEGGIDHDLLTGFGGSDTLDGGSGNDTLEGGEGGDRYFYSANGGHDRIVDVDPRQSDPDGVVFSSLRSTSLTRVQRDGANLQLHFGSTNSLLLVNQMDPNCRIETFQFANVTWDHATLLAQVR